MIKVIIFDFFGVIRTDAYETWLKAHGLTKEGDFFEISRMQDSGKITNEEFYKELSKLTGRTVKRQDLDKSAQIHFDTLDVVSRLKKHYRIALLSNSPLGLLRRILAENNLEHYFDEIIISSEVELVKPSPEIFTLTLNQFGVTPSEALFVDDNKQHVQAAEKVGIKSIHFLSAEQLLKDLKRLDLNV